MLSQEREGRREAGKEGGSTRGGMKKVRKARKQSVEGSGIRKRWWRNEMGKEDGGHCGEKQFWINIKESFFIGCFINNSTQQYSDEGKETPPCLGYKA